MEANWSGSYWPQASHPRKKMKEEYTIHNRMQEAISELAEELDGWEPLPIEWSKVTGLPTVGVTDETSNAEANGEPIHRIKIRAEPDSRYVVTGFSGKMADGEYQRVHHIAWLSFEDKGYHDPPLSGLDAAIDYSRMVCNSAMIRTEVE